MMTRGLASASCQDDVLRFETSEETIYAVFPTATGSAVPCDRFWDDESTLDFVGKQVAIVLEVTKERFRVLIETLDGYQGEFTVAGIWVG